MPGDEVDEEFVRKPVQRAALFVALREGPATRAELAERLDVSSATLHRIVRFLDGHDLAVETDEGLELTPLGEVVAATVADYVEGMTTASRLAPLINGIDPAGLPEPFDLSLFADASVTLPAPSQPNMPAQRFVEILEGADSIRGLGPVVLPIYVEVFHREILEGMDAELVIEPTVLAGLEEGYAEPLADALATGQLSISIHDDLPFGLFVTPGMAGILGYDREDVLRILVEGTGEDLRAWAEAVYEHYRAAADPLPAGDGDDA